MWFEIEVCELPREIAGFGSPRVGGSEIDVGTLGAFAAFKLNSHCLDTVLFLIVADHHGFFSEHHVTDAVSVIADTLVAV